MIDSLDTIVASLGDRSDEFARAADNLGVASEGTAEIDQRTTVPASTGRSPSSPRLLASSPQHKADLDAALIGLPETTHALNRATTYGKWANLNVVCINDICGPGFESATATQATAADAQRSSDLAPGGGRE